MSISDKYSILMTQIRIKNFKCFEDVVVPLRKLTIIYGQNSSGKSTIMQALDLLRVACLAIARKSAFDARIAEILENTRWLQSSYENLLRDENKPFEVGITFRLMPVEKTKQKNPDFITMDFCLGRNWAEGERLENRQGLGLPEAMKIGFRYGMHDDSGARNLKAVDSDIDVGLDIQTRKTEVKDESKNRQFIKAQFSEIHKQHLIETYPDDREVLLSSILERTSEWGDCPFFLDIPQAVIDAIHENIAARKVAIAVKQWLNRAWDVIDYCLQPDRLFAGSYAKSTETGSGQTATDTVHIPADEDYVVDRSGKPAERRKPTLGEKLDSREGLFRRDVQTLVKPALLERLNAVLTELEIPYTITPEAIKSERLPDNGHSLRFTDVGYGVQYLVPRLLLLNDPDTPFCCIEEPESHVHPRLQAYLGKHFMQLVFEGIPNKQIIVDSHSENILRMIRAELWDIRRINQSDADSKANSILALYVDTAHEYYEEHKSEGEDSEDAISMRNSYSTVNYIRIDSTGRFVDSWPKGFFPEQKDLFWQNFGELC